MALPYKVFYFKHFLPHVFGTLHDSLHDSCLRNRNFEYAVTLRRLSGLGCFENVRKLKSVTYCSSLSCLYVAV